MIYRVGEPGCRYARLAITRAPEHVYRYQRMRTRIQVMTVIRRKQNLPHSSCVENMMVHVSSRGVGDWFIHEVEMRSLQLIINLLQLRGARRPVRTPVLISLISSYVHL